MSNLLRINFHNNPNDHNNFKKANPNVNDGGPTILTLCHEGPNNSNSDTATITEKSDYLPQNYMLNLIQINFPNKHSAHNNFTKANPDVANPNPNPNRNPNPNPNPTPRTGPEQKES